MLDFKVDFALLLYDEFDGAPSTDANILFRHEGRIVTPLRKREGFYVFRGLDVPDAELEINRPHYHKKRKHVIKNGLDPGYPVVRARLLREYPGTFSDCEWLHGSCPPDSTVLALAEEEGLRLGSLEQDETGAKISLPGYGTRRLSGRRFTLNPKSGETFIISEMLSPGVYRIDKTPAGAYKSGCSIYRAYLSRGSPDGHYSLPVEKGHSGRITKAAYFDEENGKWVYVSATAHK